MNMEEKAEEDPDDHLPGIENLRIDFFLELVILYGSLILSLQLI